VGAYQHERIRRDRSGAMSARTRAAFAGTRRTSKLPPQRINPWVWVGLLGLGAFAFLKSRSANAATPGPVLNPAPVGPYSLLPIQQGTQNIPELPSSMAPTGAEVSASGSFWSNLVPVASIPSGYINFPSGAQAAATLFPTRMDASGNYYVQWAGLVYLLGNQDGSGNWPAVSVG
jgi:hypothetical protein